MPNTAVRAAAEGLPAINRRTVLRGLAALSASTGAAVAAGGEIPHQDAELLALGREMEAADDRFMSAMAAEDAALSQWKWLLPEIPDVLCQGKCRLLFTGYERLQDPAGNWMLDRGMPIYITTADYLRAAIESPLTNRRLRDALESLVPIAEEFEAGEAAAREKSGVEAATTECFQAGLAVERIANKIRDYDAATLDGVVVKARALLTFSLMWSRRMEAHPDFRAVDLAGAVMRLVGERA